MYMDSNESIIKEILQSSNVNFLFGAGASSPYLPLLGGIEERLNTATVEKDKISLYKEYLAGVMLPCRKLLDESFTDPAEKVKYDETVKGYLAFIQAISNLILKRKTTILGKQVNIFTTNIDLFFETILEKAGIEYCDGFVGNVRPTFRVSNFKRSILQRSLYFENISEIPVFNLLKLHGSLTWQEDRDGNIVFSKMEHIKDIVELDGKDFLDAYKKIMVVNPEASKYSETVLDRTYFDMLRIFASELEKENSSLFVIGFSMEDKHLREILFRAADSNPTLCVYIFCHSYGGKQKMIEKMKINERKYKNIEIIGPEDEEMKNKMSLGRIVECIFSKIPKDLNEPV